ncbi:MAG: TniQ family protein [Pseudonocardia sp.]|nr:TniQ family protein [Pseudonocardia sp.]
MIPQHSGEQAIILAGQDWTVSAIARHLGHDRKTIRIYLNGRRTPGQPRQQADSFDPFAGYAARRVRDDPHLRAAGLHRELAGVGYGGSYSALTRELRSSGISLVCVACGQKPQAASGRAAARRHRQSLPIRVAPIAGETTASYLTRLAAANHLPVGLVLAHLPRWFTARICTHDDLGGAARADTADAEHLAALSGLTTAALLHALPAFGSGADETRPPMRGTRACRRCASRQGHAEPVPVHLPAHQRLCARHRIWLGNTTQIDLAATPEIIHAQRRAVRLARRYGAPRLMLAEVTAHQQIIASGRDLHEDADLAQRRITTLAASDRRLGPEHPDLVEAATYPETINSAAAALNRPH